MPTAVGGDVDRLYAVTDVSQLRGQNSDGAARLKGASKSPITEGAQSSRDSDHAHIRSRRTATDLHALGTWFRRKSALVDESVMRPKTPRRDALRELAEGRVGLGRRTHAPVGTDDGAMPQLLRA